jgi:hypothetical protein
MALVREFSHHSLPALAIVVAGAGVWLLIPHHRDEAFCAHLASGSTPRSRSVEPLGIVGVEEGCRE